MTSVMKRSNISRGSEFDNLSYPPKKCFSIPENHEKTRQKYARVVIHMITNKMFDDIFELDVNFKNRSRFEWYEEWAKY